MFIFRALCRTSGAFAGVVCSPNALADNSLFVKFEFLYIHITDKPPTVINYCTFNQCTCKSFATKFMRGAAKLH